MNEQNPRVVCIGEVMIEMARGSDGRFGIACGGDTFNTAIYLARCGVNVAYATALGDDRFSDGIVAIAAAEGVATDLIPRLPGRLPGLYLIETDPEGERHFHYWRDNSPARELFEAPEWGQIAESLVAAQMIYFSGVTLGIYSNNALGRFLAVLELARKSGVTIAFDSNFRPAIWKGDVQRARTVFTETLKRVDVALPTFDDEALLWGDASPQATADRLRALGIAEIVIKNGQKDALIVAGGRQEFIAVPEIVEPIDTTAAGDSFNAGYLAARLSGTPPEEAVAAAHKLAADKIRHRGAIMPRAATAVH
jgi:2-dehydro-3-deoxygluconokinase